MEYISWKVLLFIIKELELLNVAKILVWLPENNPAIWLVKNILGNNSRTRILPNIGFAMESQQIKQFSFCIVFEKTNEDNLKKIQNALFAKIWEKMNFPQKSKFVIF